MVKQDSQIIKRYAKSLVDLSASLNSLEVVTSKFRQLCSLLKEHPNLSKAIDSPICSKEKQYEFVNVLFNELLNHDISKETADMLNNFLKLLVKNGRLSLLSAIYEQYAKLLAELHGEIEVSVISAVELSAEQKESLISSLKNLLKKDIILNIHTDKSLIGGFVVNFGSYQIDTSILTKLNSLKLSLKEAN